MGGYKDTLIWRKLIAEARTEVEATQKLEVAYDQFRHKVAALTSLIGKSLPNLTVHDVTHLDGLWSTGSLLIDDDYPLNPLEAFVFGCAVLLHDSALSMEAFGGEEKLRNTTEWQDAYALLSRNSPNSSNQEVLKDSDFAAIRKLHADQAAELVTYQWSFGDGGSTISLLENDSLRKHYGPLIGRIASSHHWDIERVATDFDTQFNAIPGFPSRWVVNPSKIAALLRCADALHIDQTRAPDFLHAILKRSGLSVDHWNAQNQLAQPALDNSDPNKQTITFTSTGSFLPDAAEAWWVAYDLISLANREIRACNSMLEHFNSESVMPFAAKRIAGADSPDILTRYVRVSGWSPKAAQIHVSDIASLVRSLGGENLYGVSEFRAQLVVVLRELIQNSADAIRARRSLDDAFGGQIVVSLRKSGEGLELCVSDDGIGMSERVLTGSFLDFSDSFWSSSLVNDEFPGLLSTGFKSAGRFGVGFYSGFMVADQISVQSRRFNKGIEDTRTLKFENGISLRPKLLNGPKDGQMSVSTSISLGLNDEEFKSNTQFQFNSRGGDPLMISFQNAVGFLVSSLDETVKVVTDEQPTPFVHVGLPRRAADKRGWLNSHLAQSIDQTMDPVLFQNVVESLEFVDEEKPQLGLAALNPTQDDRLGGGVRTVGGLRPSLSTGGSEFIGFIDCEPDSAKRNPKQWSAGKDAVSRWANGQISMLKVRNLSAVHWHFISSRLKFFGVDPSPYLTMPVIFDGQLVFFDLNTLSRKLLTQPMVVAVERRIHRVNHDPYVPIPNGIPRLVPYSQSWQMMLRDAPPDIQEFSFLDCLSRSLRQLGQRLDVSVTQTNTVSKIFNVPIDLIHLSSREMTG